MHRLLFVLLCGMPLLAQTSDCAKIETTAQASQCYSKELVQAEADMKSAYQKMLASYAPTEGNLKGLKGTEREEQRQWYIRMQARIRSSQTAFLAYRQSACAVLDEEYKGGTIHAIVAPSCRLDLTKERVQWLRQRLEDDAEGD